MTDNKKHMGTKKKKSNGIPIQLITFWLHSKYIDLDGNTIKYPGLNDFVNYFLSAMNRTIHFFTLHKFVTNLVLWACELIYFYFIYLLFKLNLIKKAVNQFKTT